MLAQEGTGAKEGPERGGKRKADPGKTPVGLLMILKRYRMICQSEDVEQKRLINTILIRRLIRNQNVQEPGSSSNSGSYSSSGSS